MTNTSIRTDHRNHEEPPVTIPGIEHTNGHTSGVAMSNVDRRVFNLEAQVKALTERIGTLETTGPRAQDDVNQKIMELMRQHPGLKFTPFTVAGNIGQPDSTVGKRLRRMADQGLIAADEEPGRTRTYYLPVDGQ